MGSLLEMAKSDAHPLPRQMELLGLVSDGIALTVATATAKMSDSGGGGDVKEPLTADQEGPSPRRTRPHVKVPEDAACAGTDPLPSVQDSLEVRTRARRRPTHFPPDCHGAAPA